MSIRITEGEITSCSRALLRHNGFKILSSSAKGEKLYYRTEISSRPQLKQPDTVAFKDNHTIVIEDKIRYSDLFKTSGERPSDVEKLLRFMRNEAFVQEFRDQVHKVTGPTDTAIEIHCGCSSLAPGDSTLLPDDFLFFSVSIEESSGHVNAQKLGHIANLFPSKSCCFEL